MPRQINTLQAMFYNGPSASWRGGERRVMLFWKGKKRSRMLDLDALCTLIVRTDTLHPPFARSLGGGGLQHLVKRLGTLARERQRAGADIPLETIGAVIVAARKAKYKFGDL